MSQLKTLTDDVVSIAVDALLLINGKTTTLDVKNWLRDRGYNAKQEDVSEMVNEYYENGIVFEIDEEQYVIINRKLSGNHYEYFLEEAVGIETEDEDGEIDLLIVPKSQVPVVSAPAPAPQVGRSVTPARPSGTTNRDYISMHMSTPSSTLAALLGISADSVRAYKANINR